MSVEEKAAKANPLAAIFSRMNMCHYEERELNYAYVVTGTDGADIPEGVSRRACRPTTKANITCAQLLGQKQHLAPPMPEGCAQKERMANGLSGIIENIKDAING